MCNLPKSLVCRLATEFKYESYILITNDTLIFKSPKNNLIVQQRRNLHRYINYVKNIWDLLQLRLIKTGTLW